MRVRKIFSRIIGVVQGAIGAVAVIFAYVLYHNFFNLQDVLNVTAGNLPLYILFLLIFGLLSIISGLFLMYE